MKKINTNLNIIMGSCIGVFFGMSIYQCYDHYAHPGLYELTSAHGIPAFWCMEQL